MRNPHQATAHTAITINAIFKCFMLYRILLYISVVSLELLFMALLCCKGNLLLLYVETQITFSVLLYYTLCKSFSGNKTSIPSLRL